MDEKTQAEALTRELVDALRAIGRTLTIPAAEYVPAIGDVFEIIDAAIAKAEAAWAL